MLTTDEQRAWDAYVEEMDAKGLDVDLSDLMHILLGLDEVPAGEVIAAALGVGTMPIMDLAKRLTLQTKHIMETGHLPISEDKS